MDTNLLKLLLMWGSKLGLGTTLLTAIVVAAISYTPILIEKYSGSKVINAADTQISVIQKLYYHNETTISGFRSILSQYNVEDERTNKPLVFAAKNVVESGLILATDEMNRMPYCMEQVGDFMRQRLDDENLRGEIINIVSRPDLTDKDRFDFAEQVMKSYQRNAVKSLHQELKEVKLCAP